VIKSLFPSNQSVSALSRRRDVFAVFMLVDALKFELP